MRDERRARSVYLATLRAQHKKALSDAMGVLLRAIRESGPPCPEREAAASRAIEAKLRADAVVELESRQARWGMRPLPGVGSPLT